MESERWNLEDRIQIYILSNHSSAAYHSEYSILQATAVSASVAVLSSEIPQTSFNLPAPLFGNRQANLELSTGSTVITPGTRVSVNTDSVPISLAATAPNTGNCDP